MDMGISSLQKLLGLDFDYNQVRLEFDKRPDNAVILGEMTAEESFLFQAGFFCFYRLKFYKRGFEQINTQNASEIELDEVNNKLHYWFNKFNLCNILLSHKVYSRLGIDYSKSFYILSGFLIAIDLGEKKVFISNHIDADGNFIDAIQANFLFLN